MSGSNSSKGVEEEDDVYKYSAQVNVDLDLIRYLSKKLVRKFWRKCEFLVET